MPQVRHREGCAGPHRNPAVPAGIRRPTRAEEASAKRPHLDRAMTETTDSTDTLATFWDSALSWDDWFPTVATKRDIWESNLRRAKVHPDEAARFANLPAARKLLVLVEDWCGDAARSVPPIQAAVAELPDVEARYLPVDKVPEVLAGQLLSHGGRSIPLVLVADEHGEPLGTWGPRPAPLQALFRKQRAEQGAPTGDAVDGFYQPIMAWYAKDKGRTTLQELLMILERGGAPR
jgi:hypothetical protein